MTAECEEAFARMRKEYVPPTEKDVLGNAALILVPSSGATPDSGEWLVANSLNTASFTAVSRSNMIVFRPALISTSGSISQ